MSTADPKKGEAQSSPPSEEKPKAPETSGDILTTSDAAASTKSTATPKDTALGAKPEGMPNAAPAESSSKEVSQSERKASPPIPPIRKDLSGDPKSGYPPAGHLKPPLPASGNPYSEWL